MSNNPALRLALVTLYLLALSLPVYHFFQARGGPATFQGLETNIFLQLLFPLLGLIAFTLITFQVLIATNLRWLTKLWPNIIHFHRAQGTFALLFVLLHPFFILLGYGFSSYISYQFVSSGQKPYLIPAYTALAIVLLTVTTALVAWSGVRWTFWRHLHRLNYLVFPLVWIHSWNIGSDIYTTPLRWLWVVYGATILCSIGLNYFYRSAAHQGKI